MWPNCAVVLRRIPITPASMGRGIGAMVFESLSSLGLSIADRQRAILMYAAILACGILSISDGRGSRSSRGAATARIGVLFITERRAFGCVDGLLEDATCSSAGGRVRARVGIQTDPNINDLLKFVDI